MDWITLTSIAFTAAATISIAVSSWVSLRLSQAIKRQEEIYRESLVDLTRQHQSELRDLYQAITIATLIGGHSTFEETVTKFKNLYPGEVKIFKEDEE